MLKVSLFGMMVYRRPVALSRDYFAVSPTSVQFLYTALPYSNLGAQLFHGLNDGMPIALATTSVHYRKLRHYEDDNQ